MNYSNNLPRYLYTTSKICQMLNINGDKCNNVAVLETLIFSDPELYNLWVVINLCEECACNRELKLAEEKHRGAYQH